MQILKYYVLKNFDKFYDEIFNIFYHKIINILLKFLLGMVEGRMSKMRKNCWKLENVGYTLAKKRVRRSGG